MCRAKFIQRDKLTQFVERHQFLLIESPFLVYPVAYALHPVPKYCIYYDTRERVHY